jgi:L-threonylcarbamoyladenylate synthase
VTTHLTTSPTDAAVYIRRGEVVAFPTETVYGLGADAFNPEAVQRIFVAKGRPSDNPLIVHIHDLAQVDDLAAAVPETASTLLEYFVPGPLTLILPKRPTVPDVVTGGLDTVGIRMPRHPVAQAFLKACACPVAAPSANRSGRPSPTTWEAVRADLDGRIPCILKGDRTPVGLESTVVDCTEDLPLVLRAGAITLEDLRSVWPSVRMSSEAHTARRRSPGTRYRHYAPRARLCLVDHPEEAAAGPDAAYIGLDAPDRAFALSEVCDDLEHYAHELFAFFRRCDAAGIATIYAQRVPARGLGVALMDRLRRAAAR